MGTNTLHVGGTLTALPVSVTTATPVGNTLAGLVNLTSATTVNVIDSGAVLRLTIPAAISGAFALTKVGAGTFTLNPSAANTYTGATTVSTGTLVQNATGGVAVPGALIVGDSLGGQGTTKADVVRLLASNQVAVSSAVTVNNSGLLDLNGFSNTVGVGQVNALTLTGGTVATGAGVLTLGGIVLGQAAGPNMTPATISGNLNLGGVSRTLTVGSVDFSAGGTLLVQASGASVGGVTPNPGTNYDRLVVTGATTLGGTSALVADLAGLTTSGPVPGVVFWSVATGTPAAVSLDVTAPAAELAFVTTPGTTVAGQAIAGPGGVVIAVQDQYGNIVSTNTASVTVALGSNPAGGTLGGTLTVNAVNGLATFPNLSITKAGTGYTPTVTSSGLTADTPAAFTITAGAAAAVTVTSGGGQSATVNTPFTNPLVATVTDSFGNAVSGASVTFTAPASGASAIFSNSTATISGATNAAGQLSQAVTANTVSGAYTVAATTTGVAAPANFALTNTAGAAANAILTGGGQTPTVNTAFTNPLVVTVVDSFGNPVPGVNVTLTAPAAGASGRFSNSTNTITAATNTAGDPTVTATDTLATSPVITGTGPTISARGLTVASLTPTPTGAVVTFTRPVDLATLALYGAGTATIPDVTLVGAGSGPIFGTLLLDATRTTATFNATATYLQALTGFAPVLPDDTYTLTLKSGATGFRDAGAVPLGGTNTGGGADFVTTFDTTFVGAVTPVLGLPDFARGPNGAAAVRVPNTAAAGAGIPVTLYQANGMTAVTFTLKNNPALLSVTGTALTSATLPAGSTFTLVSNNPTLGVATFSFHNATPQNSTGSPVVLGDIVAAVPNTAGTVYEAKELLRVSNVVVNGATAGVGQSAVHVNTYFGNGLIDAADALAARRVAAGTDTGSAGFPLVDPTVFGDVLGNGTVDGGAVTQLYRYAVGLAVAQIPVPPGGVTITPTGADPELSIPVARAAAPGGTFTVPVFLDDPAPVGSTGMIDAVLAFTYDPAVLEITAADVTTGTLTAGWHLSAMVDAATGQIGVVVFGDTAITARAGGTLVVLTFRVRPGAGGETVVRLGATATPNGRLFRTQVDEAAGTLTLNPVPLDGAGAFPTTVKITGTAAPTTPPPIAGDSVGAAGTVTLYDAGGAARETFHSFPEVAGAVRVATADFTGDGVPDVAVATGPGGGVVQVYDGATRTLLFDAEPFGAFAGGLFVAAGDVTGDGRAELVVTADADGGARVSVFRGGDFARTADFLGIDDANFRGGARAAVGDLDGDGFADLVVAAGFGGGPRLSLYDGAGLPAGRQTHLVNDFFVFEPTLRNGVFVAAGDVDGDGFADLSVGGGPRVLTLSGRSLLDAGGDKAAVVGKFFAGDATTRGGVRVASRDLDGEGRADLIAGDGTGSGGRVFAYSGATVTPTGTPTLLFGLDAFPKSARTPAHPAGLPGSNGRREPVVRPQVSSWPPRHIRAAIGLPAWPMYTGRLLLVYSGLARSMPSFSYTVAA